MKMSNKRINPLGLNNPVPAAFGGEQAGYPSSSSNYCNVTQVGLARVTDKATGLDKHDQLITSASVAHLAEAGANATGNQNQNNEPGRSFAENPFRASAKVLRSPPIKVVTQSSSSAIEIDDDNYLKRLKTDEETAFVDLGNKLRTMNAIVSDARNVHKTIRDNLLQAVALYQQLREYKEAIALNNIQNDCYFQNQTEMVKSDKQTQTGEETLKDGSKRVASFTPEKSKPNKKIRRSEPEENTVSVENEKDKTWSTVENKKKRRNAQKNSKNFIRAKGETITINAGGSSYADILKEMKTAINPDEIGIGIKKIRKTVDGNVFIEMAKGEGQAKILEGAIKKSLGENLQVQKVEDKFLLDIRDMEETTEEWEISNAILQTSSEKEGEKIKVCNIRNYYGGTKQALVEVPRNIAATILKSKKIKIGLVLCRVRRKIFAKRCFRCLELGHVARDCRGKDRSQTCRRCGIDGHKSNMCKSEPRCIICSDAGRQHVDHLIGRSNLCSSNVTKTTSN